MDYDLVPYIIRGILLSGKNDLPFLTASHAGDTDL